MAYGASPSKQKKEPTDEQERIRGILQKFRSCTSSDSDQRSQWLSDMRFKEGEQWPYALKNRRESGPNPRPCLVINITDQHCLQIENDIRQNPPAIKIRPVSMNAETDVAEVYDGVIRHILACSQWDTARNVATGAQVGGGFGYWRICTHYVDEENNEQEIYIEPVYNALSVYMDPMSLDPTGSDAMFAFVVDDMRRDDYEAEYGEVDQGQFMDAGEGDSTSWLMADTVRVAEYFRRDVRKRNILILVDGSEMYEQDYWDQYSGEVDRPPIIGTKTKTESYVKWCKLTSFKILEEGEYPCAWIPIVRIAGKFTDLEGKRQYKGIVRNIRDPQRVLNYQWSALVETSALQPKVPYMVAEGQIDGHEEEWRQLASGNRTYVTYKQTDSEGRQAPQPQRQALQMASDGLAQGIQMANEAIKGASGQYEASLGQKGNETSGRAIVAREKQGDNATFHFPDHLQASVQHTGRILLDMIPRIYDTKRVMRILNEDGSSDEAAIDPTQPMPVREVQEMGNTVRKIYNLNIGRYDVLSTTGPSYPTKRQEAVDAMTTIMQANPNIFPVIGDIWVRNQDWPGSDEISERLKIMLPDPIKQAEAQEGAIPPQLQAQFQQMQMQMQQMGQALQQAQMEMQKLQTEKMSKQAEMAMKQIELQMKQIELQETQIEAQTKQMEAHARVETAHAENIRSAAAVVQPSAADNMGAIG